METKDLEKLQEEIKSASAGVQGLVEKQQAEIKQYGETTAKTAAELKAAGDRIDQLEAEKKGYEDRLGKLEAEIKRGDFGTGQREIKATPGMQFLMSDEFKNAKERGLTNTGRVDVGYLFGTKTLVGDGSDRAPVFAEQVPELIFDPGQREMTLRSIMSVSQTNSNSINYFQETTFDEDGAASQNGEGGDKHGNDMGFELKTANVETIADSVPASRQVLEDQVMLQSYIDGRLTYGVERELERQIVFGSGVGGELLGIHNNPGVQTIGAPSGDDTQLDLIRKAFAQVRLSEYAATAIILNPSDWASIELLKGSDDRYVWATVPDGGVPRVLRVPVIETTVMEEGRFLAGAFGLGAKLWDRMGSTIRISDSHGTNFTKNVLVILAEIRAALTVERPKAFVKGVFDSTLST